MGIKWKEDYGAKTQRSFGLFVGFAAGLVAAWVLYGVFTSWGMVKQASLWEIMTAVGTVGAALGAVWIAVSDRYRSRRARKIQSIIYVWKIHPLLKELNEFFSKTLYALGSDVLNRDKLAEDIATLISQIEELDFEALYEYHYTVCVNIFQVRNGLKNLLNLHQNAFHDDGVIRYSFGSMLKTIKDAQFIIKNYNGDRYLL